MSWREKKDGETKAERRGSAGDKSKPMAGAARMAMMMEKFSTPATGASPSNSPRANSSSTQQAFFSDDASISSTASSNASVGGPMEMKTKSLRKKSSSGSLTEPKKSIPLGNRAPRDRSPSESPARRIPSSGALMARGPGKLSQNRDRRSKSGSKGVVMKPSAAKEARKRELDPDVIALLEAFPSKDASELSAALFAHAHDYEATWTTLDAQRRGGGIRDRSRSSSVNERASRSGSHSRSSSNPRMSTTESNVVSTPTTSGAPDSHQYRPSFPSPIIDSPVAISALEEGDDEEGESPRVSKQPEKTSTHNSQGSKDAQTLKDLSLASKRMAEDISKNSLNQSTALNESSGLDGWSFSLSASGSDLYQLDDSVVMDDKSTPNFLSAVKKSKPISLRETNDEESVGSKTLMSILNRNMDKKNEGGGLIDSTDKTVNEDNENVDSLRVENEEEEGALEQRKLLEDILKRHRVAPKLKREAERSLDVKPMAAVGKFLRRTDWQNNTDENKALNEQEEEEKDDKPKKSFTVIPRLPGPITKPLMEENIETEKQIKNEEEVKEEEKNEKNEEDAENNKTAKRATSATLSKMKLELERLRKEVNKDRDDENTASEEPLLISNDRENGNIQSTVKKDETDQRYNKPVYYDRKAKEREVTEPLAERFVLAEQFRPAPRTIQPYRHDANWQSNVQSEKIEYQNSKERTVPSIVKPYRHEDSACLRVTPHGPPISLGQNQHPHERRGLHMDYVQANQTEAPQVIEAFAEPFYIPDFHAGGVLGREDSRPEDENDDDEFDEAGDGGIRVAIKGKGVGAVYIVACLLCDIPAKVIDQSSDEIVVLADVYKEGLRHPVVGDIELQNTRDEVMVFANAFAYVPVALLMIGDNSPIDADHWKVEGIVDTTYMASKVSPSHSISMGFDELNFTTIRHWHTVRMKVDPDRQTLLYKLGARDDYHVVARLNMKDSAVRDPSAEEQFQKLLSQSKGETSSHSAKAFSVVLDREKKNGRHFTVSLLRDGFNLVIQTENAEQQVQWAAALQHAINDGNHPKLENLLLDGLGLPVVAKKAISANPITMGKRRGRGLKVSSRSRLKSPLQKRMAANSKSAVTTGARSKSPPQTQRHYWQH